MKQLASVASYPKLYCIFNDYSKEDCLLLEEAISFNFEVVTESNILISRNWKNSKIIFDTALKIIMQELFSKSDENGFPDAIEFVNDLGVFSEKVNTKDILSYLLRHRILSENE
jgi:hypothetical protein